MRHRERRQTSERRRPHLARGVAELPLEGATETGGVCKAQVLGNLGDGLGVRRVRQDRTRFKESLALNVPGNSPDAFEQPVEAGAGHSDKPAQDCRV